ncbi:MAG TPA: hypothetical protein VFB04_13440 [Terriglobales bacterium]|nr:hypothetical protein [Terriglobales bacterium]
MFYTDRIKNLAELCPQLSRIWIKTGNPKMPLKSVWIDNAQLSRFANEACTAEQQSELAEDHLVLAA